MACCLIKHLELKKPSRHKGDAEVTALPILNPGTNKGLCSQCRALAIYPQE